MKRSFAITTALIVLSNIIAVFCMLFFKWNVLLLAIVYWTESLIIGLVTLGKMFYCLPGYKPTPGQGVRYSRGGTNANVNFSVTQSRPIPLIFGFIAIYGGVLAIYGLLVLTFLSPDGTPDPTIAFRQIAPQIKGFSITVLAMFVQHMVNTCFEMASGPDWIRRDPVFHAWRVMGRVFALHIIVILGAFIVKSLALNVVFMILFVAVKTAVEISRAAIESGGEWNRSFSN